MSGTSSLSRFADAYGQHRATEGRGQSAAELLLLPYVISGPLARQWRVRARTYDAFASRVLRPLAASLRRAPRLLDLGAGNGWLARRATLEGCTAIAMDIRDDSVDGLGAADSIAEGSSVAFERLVATFDSLPMASAQADIVVFNASVHYSTNLSGTLAEARRVVGTGGRIALLDSPFYASAIEGDAMVDEKRRTAAERFGPLAPALMGVSCIEYLTEDGLREASAEIGIVWKRHRVTYPLWYEMRPVVAALRGRRTPSRFDLWEGVVA